MSHWTPLLIAAILVLLSGIGRAASAATPAEYGFEAPDPAPTLLAALDVFEPPRSGDGAGPAVAEVTHTAGPGEVVVVAGSDFTPTTRFRFYGQTEPGAGITLETVPLVADGNAASVVVPAGLPPWSMYLLWPTDGMRHGRPVAVNRTEAWWRGPDEAVTGETAFVYGRNLARGNDTETSWVYVKPVGRAAGRWVEPTSANPYQIGFTVPPLAAGAYEVWTHNGHGGQFGWSGPLPLTVVDQSPWAARNERTFDVKAFGAAGDGETDDAAAIQRAIDAAAASTPAAVSFPPGTYAVESLIEFKDGVSWLGAGRDAATVTAGRRFAANVPADWPALIRSDDESVDLVEFKGLTIDGAENLGGKSLVIFRHHDHVKLTDCRFRWKGAVNGFNLGSNDHLTISGCEFVGDHVFLGDARQAVVHGNTFRLTDYAEAAVICWGGSEVSITGNDARDFDPGASAEGVGAGRFFVSQSHPDSNRHFYIAENVTMSMAPPVGIGDANQGEQILFEVGTSAVAASPTAVTPTTVTLPVAPPAAALQDAVIVRGRGVGQFRRVVAVHGNTVTISPAWSVPPDATSVVGVGPAQTRTVVYRNRLDGKGDYDYETASVALSMYGNVSDVVFAGNEVTRMRGGLAAEFSQVPDPKTPTPSALYFNLVANNTLNGAAVGVGVYTNFLSEDAAGTIGHLGNTYRRNSLRNLVGPALRFAADEQGRLGGDLDQDVFEHNTVADAPVAVRVGRFRSYLNNPVNTRFKDVVLYANDFRQGGAGPKPSPAFEVTGSTASFRRVGNTWAGFEAGSDDREAPPEAARR